MKKPGDAATSPGQINESKKDINIITQLDDPSLEEISLNKKKNSKNIESGLRKFSPFIAALDLKTANSFLTICKGLGEDPHKQAGKVLTKYVKKTDMDKGSKSNNDE